MSGGKNGKSEQAPPSYTLLHPYNNPSNPLPVLHLELCVASSAAYLTTILDKRVGVAEVPLLPLWAFPWVEVERWHILSKAQASREEGREDRDEDEAEGGGEEGMGTKGMGSILFSLSFTPTRSASASLDSSLAPSLSMSVAGEGRGKEGKELTEAYAHSPCSSSSSARALPLSAASTPTRPQQQHPQDQLSASLPVTDHLFTLHSYRGFTFCGVCDSLLLGFVRQGYRCERCGLDAHRECQLQAIIQRPCRGLASVTEEDGTEEREGEETDAGILAFSSAFSTPVHGRGDRSGDEIASARDGGLQVTGKSGAGRGILAGSTGRPSPSSGPISSTPTIPPLPTPPPPSSSLSDSVSRGMGGEKGREEGGGRGEGNGEGGGGIGVLELKIMEAHVCAGKCTTEPDGSINHHSAALSEAGGDTGAKDFYCRIKLGPVKEEGGNKGVISRRTRTIYKTLNPVFSERWTLSVPHYRALVSIELMDATRERMVGRKEWPIFQLLQEEADRKMRGRERWRERGHGETEEEREQLVPISVNDKELGYFRLSIKFKEDMASLFLAARPRPVPLPPQDDLAMENLRRVLDRVQAVLACLRTFQAHYAYIMNWEHPPTTLLFLLLFLYLCLCTEAEKAGALLVFSVLTFMTYALYCRSSGRYSQLWIEHDPEDDTLGEGDAGSSAMERSSAPISTSLLSKARPYRAVAKLKVSVGRIRFARPADGRGMTYVTIAYAPHGVDPQDADSDLLIGCCSGLQGDEGSYGMLKALDLDFALPFTAASQMGARAERASLFRNICVWESREGAEAEKKKRKERENDDGQPSLSSLPNQEDGHWSLLWPILQPIGFLPDQPPTKRKLEALPFAALRGCLRIRAYQDSGLSTLEEEYLGQAFLPLAAVVQRAVPSSFLSSVPKGPTTNVREMEGWIPIGVFNSLSYEASLREEAAGEKKRLSIPNEAPSVPAQYGVDDLGGGSIGTEEGGKEEGLRRLPSYYVPPQPTFPPAAVAVYLRVSMETPPVAAEMHLASSLSSSSAPSLSSSSSPLRHPLPTPADMEESRTIETMLEQEDITTPAPPSSSSTGGVFSSVWNLRSTVKHFQNLLDGYLSYAESWKNLLNWTHPQKTLAIYAALWALWLICLLLPTRYLILVAGLYEFTFRLFPEQEEYPNVIRAENLLASIPNDDDLRRVYYQENQNFLRKKRERVQNQKARRAHLSGVWGFLWEGNVQTRAAGSNQPWRQAYAAVQGNRILWWKTEKDLDRGGIRVPEGQIILRGHAGLTSPSPLEVREAVREDWVICIPLANKVKTNVQQEQKSKHIERCEIVE
ncbi:protein c kinase isoform a [Nannochloropsis gaditana]|uniref:Protein c kinase isoform a n=1 Tax=Nannochloropsis gaditana TaxID=72520 RepID=W7TGJ4_9STRA|nr:protein c kinase isoform a [Nannochloropsis gaditana]